MNKLLMALGIGIAILLSQAVLAGTPEQAKEMVEKAATYLHRYGPEKTFAAINDQSGPFRNGELYVFVHDTSGMVKAHGGFSSYIGKNTIWARDVDGKEFVKEITEVRDSDWIDYKWLNPVSKAIEQKTVYVLRVGDLLFCSGAYRTTASGK